MSVELVLNDLSYTPLAENEARASARLLALSQTISTATSAGAQRFLRTHNDIYSLEIAPGYTYYQGLFDPMFKRNNRDAALFLQRMNAKAPYLADHHQQEELEDQAGRSDFSCEARPATGLGMAFIVDGLALSFPSDPEWDSPRIDLHHTFINDAGELEEADISVMHASTSAHIKIHTSIIKERKQRSVRDGKEAWLRRKELFPNLEFCDAVRPQLEDLNTNNQMRQFVMNHLWELQRYAQGWKDGPFDKSQIQYQTSGESPSTLAQYGAARTFVCPDGLKRMFSWHSKITHNAWRIHFYPDPETHSIIIGYIGKHLSTVNDPT
jgi:hypothetical protein